MTTTLRQAARWHRPLMFFVSAMAGLAVVAAGIVLDNRVVTGAPATSPPGPATAP
jgi:hypothetical protein